MAEDFTKHGRSGEKQSGTMMTAAHKGYATTWSNGKENGSNVGRTTEERSSSTQNMA